MAGGRAGGRGGRGDRSANLEDIYERDDVEHEARTEARFQQLEQHLFAIVTLTDQVAALAVGGNPPRHRPYNRWPHEEDKSTEGEAAKNPFVVRAFGVGRAGGDGYYQQRGRGREIIVENRDFRPWESGLKINFSEFQAGVTPEKIQEDNSVDATSIEWPFTSKMIPNPIVDWNKPPVYDDDLFQEGVKQKVVEYIYKVNELKLAGSVPVLEENQTNFTPTLAVDRYGGVQFFQVGHKDIGVNGMLGHSSISFESAVVEFPKQQFSMGYSSLNECIRVQFDFDNLKNVDYLCKFIEDTKSNNMWTEYIERIWKEVVPLFFEESSKFTFGKINLKYKIDADKERRIKFSNAMENSRTSFFQARENDTDQILEN